MTLLHLTIAGFAVSVAYVGWKVWRAPLIGPLVMDRLPFEDGEFDETQDDPRLVDAMREMGQ